MSEQNSEQKNSEQNNNSEQNEPWYKRAGSAAKNAAGALWGEAKGVASIFALGTAAGAGVTVGTLSVVSIVGKAAAAAAVSGAADAAAASDAE